VTEISDTPRVFYPQCRAILQVVLDGFGTDEDDSELVTVPVLPKSASVTVNSYKQADSWSVTLDVTDLPFDPAFIRTGAIEIYMFSTNGLEDAARIMNRREPLADPNKGDTRVRTELDTLAMELATPASAGVFTLGRKPRIVGLFDDDDMELSDSGKWLTLKGQDYTAHLLAIQWKPDENGRARRIPTGKRLDLIVTDILREADPNEVFHVDVRGIDASKLPTVGVTETASNERGIPVKQETTVWDVIYKLVTRYGFIAYVDDLDIVISTPKTISDKNQSEWRRMAWGRNISHLSLKRHLGKEQVPTMVVRSYDPKTRKTISVEYPEGQIDRSVIFDARGKKPKVHKKVRERTTVSKKGKVRTTLRERDEYQIVTVYGITDLAVLKQIAETRYHLLGRAERKITVTTKDLADLDGRDLLDVDAGDAFAIQWDEFNSEMLRNPDLTVAEKIARLEDAGFNSQIASQIARRFDALQALDRPVRFKEGSIEFDVDDGYTIEMELQDFVIVDGIRADSGAVPTSSLGARNASVVGPLGKPIGQTPAQVAAHQKQHRP
jgi:hypothetical protein